MISNKDMPAMPVIDEDGVLDCEKYEEFAMSKTRAKGLTKREMFAMHAMQAWITHHGSANNYGFSSSDAAMSAVDCADALLAELEKRQ